jgi:uncharacterized protein YybS (DUF2232 family)
MRMARSKLGIETRAITEGAVMAALTAILALAGAFIPVFGAILMLVWTLPVVLICIRHGMRAGVATITVAGVMILCVTTPLTAFNMMLCSAGPALLIGCGFHSQWRTEKTVFFTAIAAFIGLAADFAISAYIMGLRIGEMFAFDPEFINEVVAMFAEYGFLASAGMTEAEMAESLASLLSQMVYFLPASLVMYSLFTAITNYLVAHWTLRKLKAALPPVTRLSTFRLPLGFIFGFILGFGLLVLGDVFWPEIPMVVTAGQNITAVFLTLYMFQGIGLILFYIGKAPDSMKGFLKFMFILLIVLTALNIMSIIGYIGIADALMDFRKLDLLPKEQGKSRIGSK